MLTIGLSLMVVFALLFIFITLTEGRYSVFASAGFVIGLALTIISALF